MKIAFKKLIELQMRHAYFHNGGSNIFRVLPTNSCRKLLTGFGLVFRATDQGFIILYQTNPDSKDESRPIHPIDEDIRLIFAVYSTDEYLLHYSDLPFDTPGRYLYYFSNLKNNHPVNGNVLLSKSEYAGPADRVVLRPKVFWLTLDVASAAVTILNDQKEHIVQEKITAKGEKIKYQVNLSNHKNGLYTLHVNGIDHAHIYADDTLFAERPFALIDLVVNQKVPAAYRFVDVDHDYKVAERNFHINLKARSTLWHYHVMSKSDGDLYRGTRLRIKHEVKNNHENVYTFGKEVTFEPRDKKTPIVFVSDAPIPLRQVPHKKIELQIDKNGKGFVTIIPHLPNPKPFSLDIDPATGQIYSDIFVYI